MEDVKWMAEYILASLQTKEERNMLLNLLKQPADIVLQSLSIDSYVLITNYVIETAAIYYCENAEKLKKDIVMYLKESLKEEIAKV